MDYLYAFLAGLLCKVYDDFNDNNMIGGHIQEVLKGSQWMLMTLLAYNDFNFSVFVMLLGITSSSVDWLEWNKPYETALLLVYPFIFFVNFHTRKYMSLKDAFVVVFISLTIWVESLLFKGVEFSTKKLISRIWGLLSCAFFIFLSPYFGYSNVILKMLYFFLGYGVFSCFFISYGLLQE
jgi:hypothetical protein